MSSVTSSTEKNAETKQSRIESAVENMCHCINMLERLANEIEDPPPNESIGEDRPRPKLSEFLSILPDDISRMAKRIEDATGRIRNACFWYPSGGDKTTKRKEDMTNQSL